MQRSAYRKRKSSLANVLQPLQGTKRPGLPSLAEDENAILEPSELRFEPSTLPDSSLADLFNNTSTANDLVSQNNAGVPSSALPFPIFTQQFIELHRSQENELANLVTGVNQTRRTSRTLQRKNVLSLQQSQACSKACRELRANNQQIKDYLNSLRTELLPLLFQLEAGLPNSTGPPKEIQNSTQDLIHYLKELGRKIWEHGPEDENASKEDVGQPVKNP